MSLARFFTFPGRSARILAGAVLVASTTLAPAAPAPALTVPGGVIGGFEHDGNQTTGDLPGGALDWGTASVRAGAQVVADDPLDSGFTQGSKELAPSA